MINTVVLMGRLTYEPELRTTPSGLSVANFSIAVERQYQAKGEDKKADFIDCQCWKQSAEFLNKYFHKGDMIAVIGSIQTENFTDKNGNKRKAVKVVCNNISFCGSKTEKSSQEHSAPNYSSADNSDFELIDDDDDLPF